MDADIDFSADDLEREVTFPLKKLRMPVLHLLWCRRSPDLDRNLRSDLNPPHEVATPELMSHAGI